MNKSISRLPLVMSGAAAIGLTFGFGVVAVGQNMQGDEPLHAEQEVRVLTDARRGPGGGTAVRLETRIVNGQQQTELWIDGERVEVESHEEAMRILREQGLGNFQINIFQGLPDAGVLERLNIWPERLGGDWFEQMRPRLFGPEFGDVLPPTPKAMLGARFEEVGADLRNYLELEPDRGALIRRIIEGTPAAEAGLKPLDVVVAAVIDGKEQAVNERTIRDLIAKAEPGTEVTLRVLRKGQPVEIKATLAEWDRQRMAELEGLRLPRALWDMGAPLGPEGGIVPRLRPRMPGGFGPWFEQDDGMRRFEDLDHGRRLLEDLRRGLEPDGVMQEMEKQMNEAQRLLDDLRRRQEELRERMEREELPEA